ncbi:MerR family transcriptional regulator [Glutamicibacter sp.]|uniref:MerR family transcriptional regulator n=1 Tax=Glutamicibacter sp. TaxID=1931995 RepID=UPI003D6BAF9A
MKDSTGHRPAVRHSIAQVSKSAGVSSRTLRHYDQIGLLTPDHVAANGYRFYTDRQLVRLQQILLLKQLGLKLETIAEILDEQRNELAALSTHKEQLHQQRAALDRQIAALEHSISALMTGEIMEPEKSFDGFNEQYKQEVAERWGADAYETSNRWWRSKTGDQQSSFMEEVKMLNQAWIEAGKDSVPADSFEAQEIAARHVRWLQSVRGTPLDSGDPAQHKAYICNLGEMYVADPRFAKNYGGYAELVRDALRIYAERTIQLD